MTKFITIRSSVIAEIAYSKKELTVVFKNRKTYKFKNVSKKIFNLFTNSPSLGKFFSQNIRNKYALA